MRKATSARRTPLLDEHGADLGIITWGWGVDGKQEYHRDVLYVDLPTGQVSFHQSGRGKGPDYLGEWDGNTGVGPQRACLWAARLLEAARAGQFA